MACECKVCGFKSETRGQMRDHIIRSHSTRTWFGCKICGTTFHDKSVALAHSAGQCKGPKTGRPKGLVPTSAGNSQTPLLSGLHALNLPSASSVRDTGHGQAEAFQVTRKPSAMSADSTTGSSILASRRHGNVPMGIPKGRGSIDFPPGSTSESNTRVNLLKQALLIASQSYTGAALSKEDLAHAEQMFATWIDQAMSDDIPEFSQATGTANSQRPTGARFQPRHVSSASSARGTGHDQSKRLAESQSSRSIGGSSQSGHVDTSVTVASTQSGMMSPKKSDVSINPVFRKPATTSADKTDNSSIPISSRVGNIPMDKPKRRESVDLHQKPPGNTSDSNSREKLLKHALFVASQNNNITEMSKEDLAHAEQMLDIWMDQAMSGDIPQFSQAAGTRNSQRPTGTGLQPMHFSSSSSATETAHSQSESTSSRSLGASSHTSHTDTSLQGVSAQSGMISLKKTDKSIKPVSVKPRTISADSTHSSSNQASRKLGNIAANKPQRREPVNFPSSVSTPRNTSDSKIRANLLSHALHVASRNTTVTEMSSIPDDQSPETASLELAAELFDEIWKNPELPEEIKDQDHSLTSTPKGKEFSKPKNSDNKHKKPGSLFAEIWKMPEAGASHPEGPASDLSAIRSGSNMHKGISQDSVTNPLINVTQNFQPTVSDFSAILEPRTTSHSSDPQSTDGFKKPYEVKGEKKKSPCKKSTAEPQPVVSQSASRREFLKSIADYVVPLGQENVIGIHESGPSPPKGRSVDNQEESTNFARDKSYLLPRNVQTILSRNADSRFRSKEKSSKTLPIKDQASSIHQRGTSQGNVSHPKILSPLQMLAQLVPERPEKLSPQEKRDLLSLAISPTKRSLFSSDSSDNEQSSSLSPGASPPKIAKLSLGSSPQKISSRSAKFLASFKKPKPWTIHSSSSLTRGRMEQERATQQSAATSQETGKIHTASGHTSDDSSNTQCFNYHTEHQCKLCNDIFPEIKPLLHHLIVHAHQYDISTASTNIKKFSQLVYKCEGCGKRFKNLNEFLWH